MRIVFMGSPEFALPTLRRLIASEHEIVAVYTQPDRPTGRRRRLAPPPVKTLALEHGLPIHQPESISKPDEVVVIQSLAPDVGVIAAYGQILRQRVLDVPRLGVLNVHASLLPRWRGASPVAAAILAGDERSGATIMRVQLQLDSGPILDQVETPILDEDTTGTLTERIADAGAALLMQVLPRYAAGQIEPQEQDDALATYAPPLKKEDALLDFAADDATTVWRKVRAYNPWPVAYAHLDGQPLRILRCAPVDSSPPHAPGTVFAYDSASTPAGAGFGVAARAGAVAVFEVQAPGGKVVDARAYLNGHREIIGKRLTAER